MYKEIYVAIAGLTFGWFLNEMGFWRRSNTEATKVRKQLLFNLLEIRHVLRQLDVSSDLKSISVKIVQILPEKERNEETINALNEFLTPFIRGLMEEKASDELNNMSAKYADIVHSLSSFDPVVAYRLSEKNKINQVFDSISNYYNKLGDQFPEDLQKIQEISEGMSLKLKPEVIKSAVSDLEDEITKLSWTVGWRTRYKVLQVLKKKPEHPEWDERVLKEIKDLMKKGMALSGSSSG